jgi:hypothetical protein
MQEPENEILDGDISPLNVSAIQLHEMFLALKSAGFRHDDAVQIVAVVLSSGGYVTYSDDFENDDLDDEYLDEEDFEGDEFD